MKSNPDPASDLTERAARLLIKEDEHMGCVVHRGTREELITVGLATDEMFPDPTKRDGRGFERNRKGLFQGDKVWRSWLIADQRDSTFELRRWYREQPKRWSEPPPPFDPAERKIFCIRFVEHALHVILHDDAHTFVESDRQKIVTAVNVLKDRIQRAKITRTVPKPAPILRLVRS